MTTLFELAGAAILLGWCAARLLNFVISPRRAILAGFSGAIIAVILAYNAAVIGMWVAVLAPFGVLLPALALQNAARLINIHAPRFTRFEILGAFAAYMLFIIASSGVMDWDIYRYGFDASGAAIVAVLLSAYAAWRGHIVILIAVVLGQILWISNIGSSNFFDQISHFLLIFVLPVSAFISRPSKHYLDFD